MATPQILTLVVLGPTIYIRTASPQRRKLHSLMTILLSSNSSDVSSGKPLFLVNPSLTIVMPLCRMRRRKEGNSGSRAVIMYSARDTIVRPLQVIPGRKGRSLNGSDEEGRCTSCGQTGITAYIINKDVSHSIPPFLTTPIDLVATARDARLPSDRTSSL